MANNSASLPVKPGGDNFPWWFSVVLPVTSTLGVLGNLVSLVVLTRRRVIAGVNSSSRPANRGLAAIAMSDLLFCLAVLPFALVTDMERLVPRAHVLRLYYRVYGTACIHLFLMVSTYLVLVTALMRFIAVAQPLHARRHPVLRFSRTIICAVFVVSALLTLPYFLLLKVQRHVPVSSLVSSHLPNPTLPPPPYASPPSLPTLAAHHYPAATAHRRPNDISADFKRITRPSWRANSSQHGSDMTVTIGDTALDQLLVGDFYEIVAFFGKNSSATRNLKVYNMWVWPIIATFVPLVALVACNGALIRLLRSASETRRKTCQGTACKDTSNRLTATLIAIIVTHLALVTPAEILKYFNPYASWGAAGNVVAAVANVLQACNFAFNFLLYLATNALFRHTLTAGLSRLLASCGLRHIADDDTNCITMDVTLNSAHVRDRAPAPRAVTARLSHAVAKRRSVIVYDRVQQLGDGESVDDDSSPEACTQL